MNKSTIKGHPHGSRKKHILNVTAYLKSFPSTAGIESALLVWGRIALRSDFRCANPDVCLGENEDCMLAWSQGAHYLECECLGNGAIEWFYRNRETGEVWGYESDSPHVSNEVRVKLMLFKPCLLPSAKPSA